MSKKASSAMGYHEAYLEADAASRNLDLEKYQQKESTSESESSSDEGRKKSKNVSSKIYSEDDNCKYY